MRKIFTSLTVVLLLGVGVAGASVRQHNYTAFKTSDHTSRISRVLIKRHCLRTEDGAGALKLVDYHPATDTARYRCPH